MEWFWVFDLMHFRLCNSRVLFQIGTLFTFINFQTLLGSRLGVCTLDKMKFWHFLNTYNRVPSCNLTSYANGFIESSKTLPFTLFRVVRRYKNLEGPSKKSLSGFSICQTTTLLNRCKPGVGRQVASGSGSPDFTSFKSKTNKYTLF